MNSTRLTTAIGLMSGTSRDGIDACLITTDGAEQIAPGAFLTLPYPAEFRARLKSAVAGSVPADTVADGLTRLHAQAVAALRRAAGDPPVDVIGFHGHTLWHRPEEGRTRQLGDGALLAALTGLPVVNDFRSADMAAGGQGAPLAPLYHRARAAGLERPLCVLNLGGVANLTWLNGPDEILAFDCGPGVALIDDWVQTHTHQPYDRDGLLALHGVADPAHLAPWLDDPYFDLPAPKSLDRDHWSIDGLSGLDVTDGAAVLTEFTAAAVARARDHLPQAPHWWLVTGGGRRNPTLMTRLADRLGVPVEPVESVGWNGDALEAECFGWLAVRSLKGLPLSLPATTGCAAPTPGGQLHEPNRTLQKGKK